MRPLKSLSNRGLISLGAALEKAKHAVGQSTLPKFATEAPGLVIQLPREVTNAHLISVGRGVKIGPNSVLKATTSFPGGWLRHPEGDHVEQRFEPVLEIGDRVTATSALQIVAFSRITIEDDVMFAGNIYISDGGHGTSRGDVPYKYQGIEGVAPVRIGRGSWIGQNVVIMPGVKIGELCVIGANSVVTGDIPDRSLAVGAPARPVKHWDDNEGRWRNVEPGAAGSQRSTGSEVRERETS